MRFSIIIPAHNAEDHIRRALESIRTQTYHDYELIVVCDACRDQTEDIARAYGARTFTVEHHRDGLTRNAGLDVAQGDWILFMDDDDWLLHEYVLQQLSNMIDLVGDQVDVIAFSFIFRGVGYASPRSNGGRYWIACWSKCWRRDFIGDTRFGGEWSVSDVGFFRQLMAKSPRICDWDMPLYYYNYMRPGSISYLDAMRGR